MLFTKSPLLKSSVSALALASLLIVGGCNRGDKGQGALKSAEISALNLDKADSKVFSKHFELNDCAIEEMESLGALAGLGLGESGDSGVTYAAREITGTKITYSDLTVIDENSGAEVSSFTAERATFYCARMQDEGPTFDRLDLKNAKIEGEDATFTFETFNVSGPSPEAAASFVEGMIDPISANETAGVSFDGLSLTGANMKGDGFEAQLKALAWGYEREGEAKGIADLMVDKLNMSFTEPDTEETTTLKFDGMSARNMVLAGFDKFNNTSPDVISNIFDGINIHQKPYDEFLVGKLTVDSAYATVDFQGIEAKATERGDIVTIKQNIKPLKITLNPKMKEIPEMGEGYEYLETLGFETMSFSGSSVSEMDKNKDSIGVSNGLFVMDDAFRLNFEYSANGLNQMVDNLKSMSDRELNKNPMKVYESLKLQSLRLTLEDNSITERGLRLASKMTGQSESNLKGMLGIAALGASLAAENDLQAEVMSETASAFADFVSKGGTFTLEINPPKPFPLASLINGGENVDPDDLGFSASQEN